MIQENGAPTTLRRDHTGVQAAGRAGAEGESVTWLEEVLDCFFRFYFFGSILYFLLTPFYRAILLACVFQPFFFPPVGTSEFLSVL